MEPFEMNEEAYLFYSECQMLEQEIIELQQNLKLTESFIYYTIPFKPLLKGTNTKNGQINDVAG